MTTMRKILIILFSGLFYVSFAQDAGRVKIALPLTESISELSLSDGVISFQVGIAELDVTATTIANEIYAQLAIPEYFNDGIPGEPSLPVYSSLIEKKNTAAYTIDLLSLDSVLIELDDYFMGAKIIPAQASKQKGRASPMEDLVIDKALYGADEWIRLPLVNLVDEGIMRGVSIGRLYFNLVSYNPGRNLLKVYYNISGTASPNDRYTAVNEIDGASIFKNVLAPVIQESRSSLQKKITQGTACVNGDPV